MRRTLLILASLFWACRRRHQKKAHAARRQQHAAPGDVLPAQKADPNHTHDGQTEDTNQAPPWQFILTAAGAATGLAALVYVIGAAVIWLRAKLIGLPTGIAIAHLSRSAVIASGLLGVVVVIVPYAIGALLLVGIIAVVVSMRNLKKAKSQRVPHMTVIHNLAERLDEHPLPIAAGDAALIVGASFISWRVFAVVVGLVAAVGGGIRWLDLTKKTKTLGTLGLVVAAIVTGLGWQITGHIKVQSVSLQPSLPGINHSVPYFGETSQYIYIGRQQRTSDVSTPYVFVRQIRELKRSKYLLTFNGNPYVYCINDPPPSTTLYRLFANSSTTSAEKC